MLTAMSGDAVDPLLVAVEESRAKLEADFQRLVAELLSDAEHVWCFQHPNEVGSAARILGVQFATEQPLEVWALVKPLGYVDACGAAFVDARG